MTGSYLKALGLAGLIIGAIAVERVFGLTEIVGSAVAKLTPDSPATANDRAPATPTPRIVRVVTPTAASERFGLTLSGRTVPIEQARLSARASGVVLERRGEIGDRVKAGDILVVIDAPEVRQQLDRAKAAVAQVRARLQLAQVTLERAEELVPKKFLPEQARDDREANVAIAKADLAAAQAEVRRLEEIERFQTVRAPFDGVIIERQVERGDRVTGDGGAAGSYFYNIARLEKLRIEVDVPQSAAMKVTSGTPARMSFPEMPGQTFEAKVVRTSQAIDQASGTMRAELVMENPDLKLPAGLTGQVVLDVARAAPCVLVPGNVLVLRQGQQLAAVVDGEDRISFRPVQIGRDLGVDAEVCSGLAVTDRVVLSPNALLKSGDKVTIAKPVS